MALSDADKARHDKLTQDLGCKFTDLARDALAEPGYDGYVRIDAITLSAVAHALIGTMIILASVRSRGERERLVHDVEAIRFLVNAILEAASSDAPDSLVSKVLREYGDSLNNIGERGIH